ncbi:hypothetical protein C8R43DRAFT_971524 [Mycena crocata]|nr:hypothetical protein C8R43DRAFT_971524 [Mycena crocata]
MMSLRSTPLHHSLRFACAQPLLQCVFFAARPRIQPTFLTLNPSEKLAGAIMLKHPYHPTRLHRDAPHSLRYRGFWSTTSLFEPLHCKDDSWVWRGRFVGLNMTSVF